MFARRLALLFALLVLAPVGAATPREVEEALDPCPPQTGFIYEPVLPRERYFPDHRLVTIPPNQAAVVDMRLDHAITGEWVQSIGYHDHITGYGERSALLLSLEGPAGFSRLFGWGTVGGLVDLEVGAFSARVAPETRWDCGVVFLYWTETLPPGDYRWVVGAVSDGDVASGLLLPPGAHVLDVTPLAAEKISEDTLACAEKVRVAVRTLAVHQRMKDCSWRATPEGRAYWAYDAGVYQNDENVVMWTTPEAPSRRLEFGWGRGPAGEYALDIPRYQTMLAEHLSPGGPIPQEGSGYGVLGLLVDVPAG